MTPARCAIYARVSTAHQTVENQLLELRAAASRMGWTVAAELTDHAISGTKGRADRPAWNKLFTMIQRREVDVVCAWSIDRLGRSIKELVGFMDEVQAAGVDLYVHQQAINTATPAGRMVFNIFASLGEFERELIVERTRSGLARAKAQGVRLGRPNNVNDGTAAAVKMLRAKNMGIVKIASTLRIGVGSVSKILKAA